MSLDARNIEDMIRAAIPDADVIICDLIGDGGHVALGAQPPIKVVVKMRAPEIRSAT